MKKNNENKKAFQLFLVAVALFLLVAAFDGPETTLIDEGYGKIETVMTCEEGNSTVYLTDGTVLIDVISPVNFQNKCDYCHYKILENGNTILEIE